GRIDPHKIDLMGRMGKFYYARASGAAVEEIVQVVNKIAIGFDGLPDSIRHSKILTGNNLGQLAGLLALPGAEEATAAIANDARATQILNKSDFESDMHRYIKEVLDAGNEELGAALAVVCDLKGR
ncbi:MAG: hypothetical protein KDC86_18645, partial [Saprospiraceae bacterium]|nr:hypothetical protein [Saprospiraceae bacterium]